jgi:hypothetical protein
MKPTMQEPDDGFGPGTCDDCGRDATVYPYDRADLCYDCAHARDRSYHHYEGYHEAEPPTDLPF